jgi:hypothetical protein
MKKLLAAIATIAVLGAGCPKAPEPAAPSEPTVLYENREFGFSFEHVQALEMAEREAARRPQTYLGFDTDFFAMLRDTVRAEKPQNVAAFHAVPKLLTEDFVEALRKSGTATGEIKTETITVNRLTLTKVSNPTDFGTDKVHYLLDRKGKTVIISVYIGEDGPFDPVLKSLKGI